MNGKKKEYNSYVVPIVHSIEHMVSLALSTQGTAHRESTLCTHETHTKQNSVEGFSLQDNARAIPYGKTKRECIRRESIVGKPRVCTRPPFEYVVYKNLLQPELSELVPLGGTLWAYIEDNIVRIAPISREHRCKLI